MSKSTIEVDNFFINLEKSLIFHIFKSKLLLNIATKYLNIECDKEVFYQVICSLTTNIMMFLENQSDEIKHIDIKVLENKITYIYKGYPLSRGNIIKLSSHMLPLYVDTFLLTGVKLFQSIDHYNMTYNFVSSGFKNKIELIFVVKQQKIRCSKLKYLALMDQKEKQSNLINIRMVPTILGANNNDNRRKDWSLLAEQKEKLLF